jgi:hypothetical protein
MRSTQDSGRYRNHVVTCGAALVGSADGEDPSIGMLGKSGVSGS